MTPARWRMRTALRIYIPGRALCRLTGIQRQRVAQSHGDSRGPSCSSVSSRSMRCAAPSVAHIRRGTAIEEPQGVRKILECLDPPARALPLRPALDEPAWNESESCDEEAPWTFVQKHCR